MAVVNLFAALSRPGAKVCFHRQGVLGVVESLFHQATIATSDIWSNMF